tara:strand:+ start:312 stop:521 length:210 start_codon:yes stop_codon:yes gene_type:complete
MKPEVIFIANYVPDKQESMLRVSALYKTIVEKDGLKTKTIRPTESTERVGKLKILFSRIENGLIMWTNL